MSQLDGEAAVALERYVTGLERELTQVLAERQRLRDAARDLDRTIQTLETRLAVFRDVLAEGSAGPPADIVPIRRAGRDLAGLPRVQAIEIILAEDESRDFHRKEVFVALRQRGFPNEELGDTSAALAYLKRVGRVDNPKRGHWRSLPSR